MAPFVFGAFVFYSKSYQIKCFTKRFSVQFSTKWYIPINEYDCAEFLTFDVNVGVSCINFPKYTQNFSIRKLLQIIFLFVS